MSWSLSQIQNGTVVALRTELQDFVLLQDDGSINVNFGDNMAFKDEVVPFILRVTSNISTMESQNTAEFKFSITILEKEQNK